VDVQRIVFNPHYLTYIDTAMSAYWNAMAMPYVQTMQGLACEMFLKKVTVEFQAPAHMDDVIEIGLRCDHIGTSSIRFDAAIFRNTECLLVAQLVYVYADAATYKPTPVPLVMRSNFLALEAGEPMLQVQFGTWDVVGTDAARLRKAVFIQEQNIPESEEWDADDSVALHAIVLNRMNTVVATGRLLPSQQQRSRIGRMAVLRPLRGTGVGQWLLQQLIQQAIQRHDKEVMVHAQCHVQAFYACHGFVVQGEPFDEVGIPHIVMVKTLSASG
jgi:YbgC/YbaW family acyl-CoA thioester hydrolase